MNGSFAAFRTMLLAAVLGAPAAICAQEQAQGVPETASAWSITLADDPDGVGGIVTMEVQSRAPVGYILGRSGPAILRLQCANNNTSVAFDFGDNYMSDVAHYGDVTLHLDDNPARTFHLEASDDRRVLGFERGVDAIPVLASWLDGQTLSVSVVRLHGEPLEAAFPVAGLREAIGPLRQQCRW